METQRCYGCMRPKTQHICEHCGFDGSRRNAPHQLPMGTVLQEQYLIGRVLGQGGFGITYLGWDLYLDIPVAIKEYYPMGIVMRDSHVSASVSDCTEDADTRFHRNRDRFLKEAKMLARFGDIPQIVQVRSFFLANNTAYIVMEFVQGMTLASYIKSKGRLSPKESLDLLMPLVWALERVHVAGIIHRDISPDNIMLLPQGGIKLLDFGAVRDMDNISHTIDPIIRSGYSPVEQYQRGGNVSTWTDVYALCATLYACMTGEAPPEAPDRILNERPLELAKVIPGLQPHQAKALEKGLAVRPENRIQSMAELARAMTTPEPKPEPPKPPKPPVPPKPPKSPKKTEPAKPVRSGQGSKIDPVKKGEKKPLGKILAIILVVILCGAAVVLMNTPTGTCGENMTWTFNKITGEMVIEGSGDMENYLPPDRIPGEDPEDTRQTVPWQEYRSQVRKLTIRSDVKSLGSHAFQDCNNLKQIAFEAPVERLNHYCFAGTGLEQLQLPVSLNRIEDGVFSWTYLRELELPAGVDYVGREAFYGCGALQSLSVGQNTTLCFDTWAAPLITDYEGHIPENFVLKGYENTPVASYADIYGYSFESLGTNAVEAGGLVDGIYWRYDYQTGFLSITGTGAIADYNGLWMEEDKSNGYNKNREYAPWTVLTRDDAPIINEIRTLYIGEGITGIGENAFAGCTNLKDVHFPSTLETIGSNAFRYTGVDEIVLPERFRDHGEDVFFECMNLWMLRLPDSLEKLGPLFTNRCFFLSEVWLGPRTELTISGENTPFGHGLEVPDMTIFSLDQHMYVKEFCTRYPFASHIVGHQGMVAQDSGSCGDNVSWAYGDGTLLLYGTGDTWLFGIVSGEDLEWALRDWPAEWVKGFMPSFHEYREEIRHIRVLPGVEGLNHNLFTEMPNLESVDFGTVRSTHVCLSNTGVSHVVIPHTMEHAGEWMLAWNENLRVVEVYGGQEYVGMGFVEDCPNLREIWFHGQENIPEGEDILSPNGEPVSEDLTFYVKEGSSAERYAQEKGIRYEYF